MTGSNRRPSACKADALPAELILRYVCPATSYSHRGRPPTTIGAKELNCRVRDGNGCGLFAIITGLFCFERQDLVYQDSWHFSSFFSKKLGLFFQNWIHDTGTMQGSVHFWLSPRSISIRQLHVSPRFHLEPIYLIVFEGSYLLAQWEISSCGGLRA